MPGIKSKGTIESKERQTLREVERHILRGLACEWENALLLLEPAQRELIRRPLFAIRDFKTWWGNWSPERREISLSRKLVLNYPWDSIRDVLLHETAHQIAQQLWNTGEQKPHGTEFKQACRLLHIDAGASANYVPLQDRLLIETSNEQDRRMIRIKKLLALAKSKNRFEAEAAMTKAHELIARHNIEVNRHEDTRRFLSIFLGSPALRHPREDYHLANLLQDFYFVSGIWVQAYVVERQKMGRVLEISGTAQNLKLAEYVHDFIIQFIDAQWRKYNPENKLNRFRKTDFAVGIIEGFADKLNLNLAKKKKVDEVFALMKIKDPQLETYVAFKYPHTATVKKTASRQDARVLNDGKKIGRKMVIARGISERKSAKPLLISGA